MSAMACQIINLYSNHPCVQAQIKENTKARRHFPLWVEPPVTGGSPHKGPVMRKIFPFDDVIINHLKNMSMKRKCHVMREGNSPWWHHWQQLLSDLLKHNPNKCNSAGYCNKEYPSIIHLKLKSRESSFKTDIYFGCPLDFNFCTEYGIITVMLCAKFWND